MKLCKKCKQAKKEFHKNKNSKDGLSSICKHCVSDYSKQRWAKNRQNESARAKVWRNKNVDYVKKYEKGKRNKKRYWAQLTVEQAYSAFMEMREKQKQCCAICDKHESNFKKGLVVDHCHVTGKVRQLLCQNCNAMIGMAKESEIILTKAIQYINAHKTIEGEVCENF